jgi:hypothetical protein
VFADDPPGVDDTRDPGQAAEKDVDQELTTAACLKEDWYGRQQDSYGYAHRRGGQPYENGAAHQVSNIGLPRT